MPGKEYSQEQVKKFKKHVDTNGNLITVTDADVASELTRLGFFSWLQAQQEKRLPTLGQGLIQSN
jgi:hypothetical protein